MNREPNRLVESAKIIAACILASVIYGIAHDQVTVRLCPAYFTEWEFHSRVFQHDNLTVVAIFWGIVATWWVGLILGFPIAFASTYGTGRWWTWKRLLKPLSVLVACLWAAAAFGYLVSSMLNFRASTVALNYFPETDKDLLAFSSVLVTHNVSYIAGAIGGLILTWYIARKRKQSKPFPTPT